LRELISGRITVAVTRGATLSGSKRRTPCNSAAWIRQKSAMHFAMIRRQGIVRSRLPTAVELVIAAEPVKVIVAAPVEAKVDLTGAAPVQAKVDSIAEEPRRVRATSTVAVPASDSKA
jgi:hypothetical protein